jgi:hypothetical protein
MGEVVPIDDPLNYRRVLQRIKKMLSERTYFMPPHARVEAAKDGFDDQDVLNIIRTGTLKPNSHSMGRQGWRYVVEGESVDHGRAACVVEITATLIIVTVYALKKRR